MLNQELEELHSRVKNIEQKSLFFIGGMVKSGTTWVERICDFHPEVVCKGEAHFGGLLDPLVTERIARYNSLIPKKGNWQWHIDAEVTDIANSEFSYKLSETDWLIRQSILLMMQKWDQGSGIRCVGEKTPSNTEYFAKLAYLFPTAKFIYVIRDIRDVIVSGWFFNIAIDPTDRDAREGEMAAYASFMAESWKNNVLKGLSFIDCIGSQGIFVRYEDILENPSREISAIFRFLGVDHQADIVEAAVRLTSFKSLSGGRERGEENRDSFYRKGISGDWKDHLNKEMLNLIDNECGPLMHALGYQ